MQTYHNYVRPHMGLEGKNTCGLGGNRCSRQRQVAHIHSERKSRKLETIPEAIRAVLGEYFKTKAA
jgi:hypothetical protein